MLFAEFAWHEDSLVIALKLGRDASDWISVSSFVSIGDETLLFFDVNGLFEVVATLFHDDIEAGQVLVAEVHARVRHVCINHLVEHLDICRGISHNALNEAMIAVGTDKDKLAD